MNNTIVFLGWAYLALGALQGGGLNLIAAEHAKYLARQGRRILYLQSGVCFDFNRTRQKITEAGGFEGVECYKLLNSRNRAPAEFNHYNQQYHLDDPKQNLLVCNWLSEQKAGTIYIHSLEGQALSLIPDIKKHTSAKVVVIVHDHFYVCPHVKLQKPDNSVCIDYNNGLDCEKCLVRGFDKNYERRMALRRFGLLRAVNDSAKRLRGPKSGTVYGETFPAPEDPNNELLNNINCLGVNFYAKRRRAAIESLDAADAVFSPSVFLGEYLIKCGLRRDILHVFKTGLPHLDELKTLPKAAPETLTFCCHGSDLPAKGVRIFINAVREMQPDLREKCRFLVKGVSRPDEWAQYAGNIEQLEISGKYDVNSLAAQADKYSIGVLPHIWFENSPVAMLEHLAVGKPVISADMGGVDDYIKGGKNGLLFPAGNAQALARLMEAVAAGKQSLPEVDPKAVNSFEGCMEELLL